MVGGDDHHFVALLAQHIAGRRKGAHDAVHLREPGIGNYRNALRRLNGDAIWWQSVFWQFHAASSSWPAASGSRRATSSGQWSNSIVPSKCSTRALHPSTQSPSL